MYLNLGSGPRGSSDVHWLNVDAYPDVNVHHSMDFNRPFPFPPNSFDGIFCEHVVEHFDLEQGSELFRRCLHVLRPGGAMRIIVPDGEKVMRTYFEKPEELISRRQAETGCAMEAVNSYFRRRYEHQCLYDFELLQHQLEAAGFDRVVRVWFRTGEAVSALLLDEPKYEWEGLYVEASEPAVSE
jgi:predicted SAM-dependent methyltransferase